MQPHQEGDLASFPVTPHAEGLRALQHADSALRLGEMPANANQKDFIRKGGSLHVDPERLLKVRARRGSRGGPPVRSFGTAFSEHSHEAARKLRAEIRRGVRAGAVLRPGEAAEAGAAEIELSLDDLSLAGGPRRHAEVVLESEAVRGNLSGATSLSRVLALRAGAPSADQPAPDHHFYFGGSRAQKRRLARRVDNEARAREANLAARKGELLRGNVEELGRMSREYELERAAELELELGLGAAELRLAPGITESPGGGFFSTSPPASYSTPLAWGVLGGLALILAGVAVYGARRAGRGRSKPRGRR